ncbi:hypothetical protein EAS56_24455 [Bradyrhizobium guangzhouense]|uniref:Uncharacterized protein n=1 Tax=Bradyrhizobium guangzhouense TaxID=1325095 RepID=A0ABY0E4G4_9BRAD|nr:hypothetical protein EAS56_24455 [Bradyrhizobium guangzhouense]
MRTVGILSVEKLRALGQETVRFSLEILQVEINSRFGLHGTNLLQCISEPLKLCLRFLKFDG